MQLSTSTSEHIKTSTCKKRIIAKRLFVALKSQQLAGYQSTQPVCRNGNQVYRDGLATRSITGDGAVQLQKRDAHL